MYLLNTIIKNDYFRKKLEHAIFFSSLLSQIITLFLECKLFSSQEKQFLVQKSDVILLKEGVATTSALKRQIPYS